MAYTDLTSYNRKQREEAELYASLKQAREAARKLEAEKQKAEEEEKIRVEQLRVNIDIMQLRVNIDMMKLRVNIEYNTTVRVILISIL